MKYPIIVSFILLSTSWSISQSTSDTTVQKQLINGSNKTTFGANQQAVGDYLVQQNLLPEEQITFKRVIYKLLIDSKGRVTTATPFFGGISAELDEKIAQSLLAMPAWKTQVGENQLSVVKLVVVIQNKSIQTELY